MMVIAMVMLVVMMKDMVTLMLMLKMVVEMMVMIKIKLILRMMIALKTIFCNSILLASPQFLMQIYRFQVQLDVNNLCSITLIGLYKPCYDHALSNICWFHI